MRALLAALLLLLTPAHADVRPFQGLHVVSPAVGLDFTTSKVVLLEGEVNPSSEWKFMAGLMDTLKAPGDLVILINSPGGVVVNGARMIEGLRAMKGPGTRSVCVVTGLAASMAFNFLSFCDVRLALPGTVLLAHKVAVGQFLPFRTTEANLRKLADELKQVDAPYRKRNAKVMGLTLRQYDLLASQEMFIQAETLVRSGYLHGFAEISWQ